MRTGGEMRRQPARFRYKGGQGDAAAGEGLGGGFMWLSVSSGARGGAGCLSV